MEIFGFIYHLAIACCVSHLCCHALTTTDPSLVTAWESIDETDGEVARRTLAYYAIGERKGTVSCPLSEGGVSAAVLWTEERHHTDVAGHVLSLASIRAVSVSKQKKDHSQSMGWETCDLIVFFVCFKIGSLNQRRLAIVVWGRREKLLSEMLWISVSWTGPLGEKTSISLSFCVNSSTAGLFNDEEGERFSMFCWKNLTGVKSSSAIKLDIKLIHAD